MTPLRVGCWWQSIIHVDVSEAYRSEWSYRRGGYAWGPFGAGQIMFDGTIDYVTQ